MKSTIIRLSDTLASIGTVGTTRQRIMFVVGETLDIPILKAALASSHTGHRDDLRRRVQSIGKEDEPEKQEERHLKFCHIGKRLGGV